MFTVISDTVYEHGRNKYTVVVLIRPGGALTVFCDCKDWQAAQIAWRRRTSVWNPAWQFGPADELFSIKWCCHHRCKHSGAVINRTRSDLKQKSKLQAIVDRAWQLRGAAHIMNSSIEPAGAVTPLQLESPPPRQEQEEYQSPVSPAPEEVPAPLLPLAAPSAQPEVP